jgi:hypothetical protein
MNVPDRTSQKRFFLATDNSDRVWSSDFDAKNENTGYPFSRQYQSIQLDIGVPVCRLSMAFHMGCAKGRLWHSSCMAQGQARQFTATAAERFALGARLRLCVGKAVRHWLFTMFCPQNV